MYGVPGVAAVTPPMTWTSPLTGIVHQTAYQPMISYHIPQLQTLCRASGPLAIGEMDKVSGTVTCMQCIALAP